MHRAIHAALCALLVVLPTRVPAAEVSPPELQCSAAVLIDPETRQVLYARHPDERRPPASLTKMMTALLVAEKGDLDRTVVVSERAAAVGETSMNLKSGEELKLRHLLTGAMLASANDAAAACAEAVAGSVEDFVALMNRRAAELGLENTHFTNPHGLHAEDHYSSARDLAILGLHVMGRAELRPIVRTEEAAVPWPGRPYDRKLRNRNRLLQHWEACDGIKTGYTAQAGRCLAASAYIDGWRLICVVLDSEDAWTDARVLLEWGFASFYKVALVSRELTRATVQVRGGVRETVQAHAARDVIAVIPRQARPEEPVLAEGVRPAPVTAGEPCGTLAVTMPDGSRETVKLVADADVPQSPWAQMLSEQWSLALLAAVLALAGGVLAHGAASEAVGARRAR
ncbi:MAG: D-alanyl-D-alanine carboxypeptidase family protein [Armatimonadota bacterium]|nr:D-alanyl-D-alanine carboxypeptidase family protein [Armatimonadota bacterium]